MKQLLTITLLAMLICGLFFVTLNVNAETVSSTVIDSNTIWTKANSPYTLTGTVTIANGITLTIEPGATINIPSNCILQINGVLFAEGTSSQEITVQGGEIHFTKSSSGSTIKNALLDSCNLVVASSVQISSNTIIGRGSANSFEAVLITAGAPSISNNLIYGADSQRGIRITGGSPTITQTA